MDRATFITLAPPGTGALQALLLARSIREFGGTVASEPIWALIPDGGRRMSLKTVAEFDEVGVRLVPFAIDPAIERIPFAVKAAAGAHAEAIVGTDLLVWLDPDTLIVGGAGEFLIDDDPALGYRPVHHRLIGIDGDAPTNGVWQVVLDACGVPEDRLFRMYTSIGERIKAYFNAGVFVVRPERGLLRAWHDALRTLAREPSLPPLFREEPLYETFLHQVVWTAVLLRQLERSEMTELSPAVNYPLHLHDRIPAGRRAISLQRLVAVRTESLLLDPEWRERIPILGSLAPWLETQPLMRSVQ
ncbi:MAG: hypothetical protein MUP76_04685 [Acidimicrobiia bacterium]|nr:hypothetical protein [Acidimicrobiia bacterium]